ncbi:hypothetical protein WMY93_019218 [Mugilogobius chulae]|uniref:Uncharacterized protein n=1 Tax=Mugilogobius chulae TaxID=88201 RepID=A0AAW0NDJ7_9GOBI
MLSSPTHSPPQDSGLQVGSGGAPQRSMLEKFRLINPRAGSRVSPSVVEMALQEEDDLSEYGDEGVTPTSTAPAKQPPQKTQTSSIAPPSKTSSTSYSKSNRTTSKDKEDKSKSTKTSKESSSSPKEETSSETSKKNSKIGSFIPKGGKTSSAKKETSTSTSPSSGIPKPGLKAHPPPQTSRRTKRKPKPKP